MKKYWDLVRWSYILLLQTYMNRVEFYLNIKRHLMSLATKTRDVIGVSQYVHSHSLTVVYC